MGPMTETGLAWAAGLFEGEGCISTYSNGQSKKAYWQLELRMTDADVVERFSQVVGVGTVYGPYTHSRHPGSKPFWQWNLRKRDEVCVVLRQMLPYLGERRSTRAREAIA